MLFQVYMGWKACKHQRAVGGVRVKGEEVKISKWETESRSLCSKLSHQ